MKQSMAAWPLSLLRSDVQIAENSSLEAEVTAATKASRQLAVEQRATKSFQSPQTTPSIKLDSLDWQLAKYLEERGEIRSK